MSSWPGSACDVLMVRLGVNIQPDRQVLQVSLLWHCHVLQEQRSAQHTVPTCSLITNMTSQTACIGQSLSHFWKHAVSCIGDGAIRLPCQTKFMQAHI